MAGRIERIVVGIYLNGTARDRQRALALDALAALSAGGAHHHTAAVDGQSPVGLDAFGFRVEAAAIGIGGPGGDHFHLTVVDGQRLVGADALASDSRTLAVEGPTIHREGGVDFHSGCRTHVVVVAVIFASACSDGRHATAIHLEIAVGGQSFGCRTGGFDIHHTALDEQSVFALDAIALRGLNIDVGVGPYHHVVVAGDAGLGVGTHLDVPFATEQQFALTEDSSLLVFGAQSV